MSEYTCALCGYTSKYIGGMAGEYPLCHRDHTNGETCYEKVTRNASIYRRSFGEQIRLMKERNLVKPFTKENP